MSACKFVSWTTDVWAESKFLVEIMNKFARFESGAIPRRLDGEKLG